MYSSDEVDLKVFVTHFSPPELKIFGLLSSFIASRWSSQYLRSWVRLIRYGTRGYQPWKRDTKRSVLNEINRNRMTYLNAQILMLSQLRVRDLQITLHTNSEKVNELISLNWPSLDIKVIVHADYVKKIPSINHSHDVKSKSPWLLTWEHKKSFLRALENSKEKSVFLILEDDVLFTQANLDYFLEFKECLMLKKLMPSFCRVEFSHKLGHYVAIDYFDSQPISIKDLPRLKVGSRNFVEMPNPYSGLVILDLEGAKRYVNSAAFSETESRELTWWGIGERAVMGLQFLDVPPGFHSRNVVLVNTSSTGVDPRTWILHQPNIYSRKREFSRGLTPNSLFK